MSIISKVIKGILGDKPSKDRKLIWPIVEEINEFQKSLSSKSDEEIKQEYTNLKIELSDLINSKKEELSSKGLDEDELDDQLFTIEKTFLDDKMVEVFSIVKESAKRLMGTTFSVMGQPMTWDMVHYDVQLMGGIVLHQGKISEMKTGEGKTLVSTLPIALNALTNRGVHVITVNEYLAERDSKWMGHLFNFLGIEVGCIFSQMPREQKREAYNKDVTYGVNSRFCFDYLEDNMSYKPEDQVQRNHVYAIVDEVDSVLIDEARTPMILSGQADFSSSNQRFNDWRNKIEGLIKEQNNLVNKIVAEAEDLLGVNDDEAGTKLLMSSRGAPRNKKLLKLMQTTGVKQLITTTENNFLREKNMQEIDESLLFSIDERSGIIDLSDKGREILSNSNPEQFVIPDIGEIFHDTDNDKSLSSQEKLAKKEEAQSIHAERSEIIHTINQLLRSYSLMQRDVDYIVKEGKVLIVDEHTGRVMHGRRFSSGLHAAIEAKERVSIERESQTMAQITVQNYFRMYEKLAGMTGTAITEAGEFMQIYGLDVVEIDTNKPIVRQDHEDMIYKTKREKYNACIEKIQELFSKGQPILVGTTSVEESETLARMLRKTKIPHNVLNAKQHQSEAEIIQRAGYKSSVTISTNMAGRGTDIKLDKESKTLGGLFILGTGRHESRRIDLQLRGRAGRQGDSGESVFYLSLEDDLMRLFGSDRIAKVMDRMGIKEGEVITHSMVTKSIERAQKKVEARNYGIRKHLLEYDDVMNSQRELVYERRNFALHNNDIAKLFSSINTEYINEMIENHTEGTGNLKECDWDELSADILDTFGLDISSLESNLNQSEKLIEYIDEQTKEILNYKKESLPDGIFENFQKVMIFTAIDHKWRQHLYSMDQLREGIQLRAYGQKNPLIEYKKEGFSMFREMMYDTNKETIKKVFRTNLVKTENSSISTSANIPTNLQTKKDASPNLGFLSPPQGAQNKGRSGQAFTQPPSQTRAPIVNDKKVGRNEKVTIRKGNETKIIKWKKAQPLVESGEWLLED
jgi:preprotein translocase subunit SecA